LLQTADLSRENIYYLLDLASSYKRDPLAHCGQLAGSTVVLMFDKPSTRTRISMETAVTRLGGHPITVRPAELQLGKGETIEDTARVISSYAAACCIRTFAHTDVERFAAAASIPIVNTLTDEHHPCQSLADLLTLKEHFGKLAGLRLAYVGDGNNNVTHSLIEAAAIVGMDMVVSAPPSYEPQPQVTSWAAEKNKESGGHLTLTGDPYDAVKGADAVYTDLWVSMGNADHERPARAKVFSKYRVDAQLMGCAGAQAVFMHCLPANRAEEVASEVIDGPQSVAFSQAANRLPTGQAVLYALVAGRRSA
jgi:ornithine carbamoyltransferase